MTLRLSPLELLSGNRRMQIYHIWFDISRNITDLEFTKALKVFLEKLRAEDLIRDYRITRRTLGLGLPELGEFHVTLESDDMAQLDRAFERMTAREGEMEEAHVNVNRHVENIRFALYRDFPDENRAE